MSAETFVLPDLGEGLTEAEVVRWLVAEGDEVRVDQPVVEVETAKSLVEVPTPYAGRVHTLHCPPGSTLAVGEPLLTVAAPDAETLREETQAGSGSVLVGYGTSSGGTGRRLRPREPRTAAPAGASGKVPRVTSPLVRQLAKSTGVDLRGVTASRQDGVITRADVERAAAPRETGVTRIPLDGVRRSVAATLTRSRREIPEATVWVDVDATPLVELRQSAPRPGLLAYLARFVVAGLREHPVLNARLDTERDEIVAYDHVNLGVAVQTDRGLLVPAVRGAERMTTTELDEAIGRVTASARDGNAGVEELTSGTFTLNNYGSFGVDGSAAIINHPQVAILGIGRILERPWVVDGELRPRNVTQLSFVFDHRVCDGGTAAGFLRGVADAIENPAAVLARL